MKALHVLLLPMVALAGGCLAPGNVQRSSVAHRTPFRSLVGQRLILQRPMTVRAMPSGMSQPYSDESGSLLPVPAEELASDRYFLGINWHPPQPAASARASDDIAWTRPHSAEGRPAGTSSLPLLLPRGTVIEFRNFERTRAYEAWLVPSPFGLLPYPPTFTATFTTPEASARPGTVYEYRWGFGRRLWAAPWEPKDKSPTWL